jgi:predicted lipid-binding transport protein (Tim44 family)
MKWNQFLGGTLVGAAFGIMLGAAFGPGSPEKVTTGTAGFCTLLAIAGGAAARIGRRKDESKQPRPDQAAGSSTS